MSIQKLRKFRIALRKKIQKLLYILHHGIERWEMSTCATRFTVPAQIKAGHGITCLCHYPANMSVTPGMFSKSVNKRNQCLRGIVRLPALYEKRNTILSI